MNTRIVSGTRVQGALTGQWYTVTVSANLGESEGLPALVSGMVRRDGDACSIRCSKFEPLLVSHTEVQ